MKKVIAMLLALVMLLGVFTACGKQEATTEPEAAPSTSTETEAPKAEEEIEPAPEVEAEPELEHVELTWYCRSGSNITDAEAVTAAINDYLNNTLNLNVTLRFVFPSDYGEQTPMAMAAGDDIDILWTGNWSFDYLSNVAKDAFYPLDDLLAEYGQDFLAITPEYGMEAVKVNGVTYAIPNQQGWFTQAALYITKEAAEKYGFDGSTLTSYKDLEPLLAQVKADNPDSYPICIAYAANLFNRLTDELNYTFIASANAVGGVLMDDETCQVVNVYDLPQVQELYATMWDWNQKGYIRSDSAQMTDDDTIAAITSGQSVMRYDTYLPGDEVAVNDRYGCEMVTIPVGDPVTTTGSVQATMTAISSSCENPERAMMVLNAFNTDPALYNLYVHGIEGVHYTVEDGIYAIPVEGTTWEPGNEWAVAYQFNALLRTGQDADTWEVTKEMNANANAVPTMGFNFDPTNVSNQMTAVSSVVQEYTPTLINGSLDPEVVYPEFQTKLEAAGLQDILDEMQAQIDAWMAAK